MRIAHTMIRTGDLDRSIAFYTDLLGMKVFKNKEYPSGKFTLVFLGYSENAATLELTYNWEGPSTYAIGTGFGHIAIETEDIYSLCSKVEAGGGKVTRPPGPMKHGGSVIAFIEDPDGYKIELIDRSSCPSPTAS